MRRFLLLLCALVLSACQPVPPSSPVPPTSAPPTRTPRPSITPIPPPTHAPTWTPVAAASATPELFFYRYTIEALRLRSYGGGKIELVRKTAETPLYNQYVFRYPSDGLTIYGYANLPRGDGPFSVIIMLHGASNPQAYDIFEQDTEYADLLARRGYIVLHPNYRNFAPSDPGENLFLAGYAIDVLNLIALVQSEAGQTWSNLRTAKPGKIGLWAFSMGGAVAWRVLTVTSAVRAAFLYAPMSGDDAENAKMLVHEPDAAATLALPTFALAAASPQNFYRYIEVPVDIHHGTSDSVVPVTWSEQTCTQLKALGKTVNCYFYEAQDHSFTGQAGQKLQTRMNNFFDKYLKFAPTSTATVTP
ncbi:MAG: alpha/beta fold hydrolase [Anaerolineales bacterium]|nr:alpha/beta fold hydrolase [Anaerolineales bacterium]MDW8277615.1 alpha/beta fold hydrolase [Anaerolineales bacterium]